MTWYWQVFLRLNAVSHAVRLQSKDCDFSSENRINFWHAMGDQFFLVKSCWSCAGINSGCFCLDHLHKVIGFAFKVFSFLGLE